ncbi:MAG: dihydrodipicolinate synthase family protein [Gemmatimonadaceae bacterium]
MTTSDIRPFGGVLAPVVTTFDDRTGELHEAAFQSNVRAHLDAGIDGIVVAGSTGEAALLDERERRQLLEWARAIVPDDTWLIAGAGAESTRSTIARCGDAAERGAIAALVVAPHYYGAAMTPDALAHHYRAVADASPIPLVLYNIPKYMHFSLAPALVAELSAHGNIVGIKDSSGDLDLIKGYLETQSDRFTVLTGHGGSLLQALQLGARGGILAVALFAAPIAVEIHEAFRRGDVARARSAQDRLAPLAKAIVAGLGVAGVKAAMDVVGLRGGAVRSPLRAVGEEERKAIAAMMLVVAS